MLRNKKLILLILSFAMALTLLSCVEREKPKPPMEHQELIEMYAEENEIPVDLLAAVIMTESAFNHMAKSHAGAIGLMQILPSTAKDMCRRMKLKYEEDMLTDPETSIKIGSYYLRYLYNNTGENWDTACAAYNAGIGNVKKWQKDSRYSDDGTTLKEIPITETKNYVSRINEYRVKYMEAYFTSEGEES